MCSHGCALIEQHVRSAVRNLGEGGPRVHHKPCGASRRRGPTLHALHMSSAAHQRAPATPLTNELIRLKASHMKEAAPAALVCACACAGARAGDCAPGGHCHGWPGLVADGRQVRVLSPFQAIRPITGLSCRSSPL